MGTVEKPGLIPMLLAIAAGGLDFSDLVEAAYIFGFESLADVAAFVDEFVTS